MKTYLIEGTSDCKPFFEKHWVPVATVQAKNKQDAYGVFKRSEYNDNNNVKPLVPADHVYTYASYRVRLSR